MLGGWLLGDEGRVTSSFTHRDWPALVSRGQQLSRIGG